MLKKILGGLVIVILAVSGYMMFQNGQVPAHVGLKDGAFSPLPTSPNAVSTQGGDDPRTVATLTAKASEEETRAAIETALNMMEIKEIFEIITVDGPYMHVVFRTPTVGYNDDVEFLIDQDAGVVHFRSQSRVGYSDRGANLARYEAFVTAYGK